MSTTARYWRFNVTATHTGASNVNTHNLEMRALPGAANLSVPGNGTATASTEFDASYVASKAFDADVTTRWLSNGAATQWLKWDFGTPKEITEITIIQGLDAYTNRAESPKSGSVETSNDDSTWTTWTTFTNIDTSTGATVSMVTSITGLMVADITLPKLTGKIYGGAAITAALPMLTGKIYGGAALNVTLPMVTFTGFTGARLDAALPALQFYAAAHDATGENALTATLPDIGLTIYGGANLPITLPKLTGSISATGTNWASINATLPALTGALTGKVSGMITAAVTLPALDMVGYFGSVISATIGELTFSATGKGGAVGSIQATLPLLQVAATVTTQSWGSISAVIPAITSGNKGAIWALLPGLELTIIGTATVAVTYEAYALNLNHAPSAEPPVDEMTRYTNYPFDRIVRYKNSYYGMNSTGLYLLEGTTDDGTAIAWDVKTHKSDFDTEQKKTIIEAFFGGRMGAAATITLHVGETSSSAYSYTTPRGATAQNYRQAFGRGIKNRYYALEASGSGDLMIDTVTLNIATLTRKV